jgi:hypothetical protein
MKFAALICLALLFSTVVSADEDRDVSLDNNGGSEVEFKSEGRNDDKSKIKFSIDTKNGVIRLKGKFDYKIIFVVNTHK